MPLYPQAAAPPLFRGKFQVFLQGFPLGYFKGAKIPTPKVKAGSVQPAGTAAPVKFPSGQVEFDDLELKAYQGTDGLLAAAITLWLKQCADARTGRALVPPQAAKRDVTIVQYDTDGREVHEWLCVGAFPLDTGGIELESGDEKPVERDMKISVDRVDQVR